MIADAEVMTPQQTLRVLVVEDAVMHQQLASGLLRRHGCSVTVVNNGRAALQVAEVQMFDLILMDVEMPEMDGMTATKILRHDGAHLNQHTPVIGLSSSGRRSDCLTAGMDDYLAKPLRDERLARVLDRVQPRPACKHAHGQPADYLQRCDANCP
jgi:CheY-like chemotaxis protein